MKGGTAILDVLTNSIGALLILVVLFVKLTGADAASLSTPLASTEQGLCSAPRIHLRVAARVAEPQLLELVIEERSRGAAGSAANFAWYPLLQPAPAALPPEVLIVPATAGQPVAEVWAPARPGRTWTVQARPTHKAQPTDTVEISFFVTGAKVFSAPAPTGSPQRHYRAQWADDSEENRVGPLATDRQISLPARSRFAADAARLILDLPDVDLPEIGGAACQKP